MVRVLGFFASTILFLSGAYANGPLPQVVPEAVGMSSERLQRLEAALRTAAVFRELSSRSPGGASSCICNPTAVAIQPALSQCRSTASSRSRP